MEIKSLEMLPSEILIELTNQILKILYGRSGLDEASEKISVETGQKVLDFIIAELKAAGSDRVDLLFCTVIRLCGATLQNTVDLSEQKEVLKN